MVLVKEKSKELLELMVLTMIAIVSANIFGQEYSSKTDAIILSAKYGKSKVMGAKFVTASSFTPFVFYLIASLMGCIIFLPLAYKGFRDHQVI